MRPVGAEAAQATKAEIIVLAEQILLQTFRRFLTLDLEVTLVGLDLARLLVARMHLVRVIARQDEVLDLQFLLV